MMHPGRFLLRVRALATKEILHIRRDPRTLYMAIGMPVLLLLLFGYGVSFDIDRVPMVVLDQDRSAQSRALVSRLTATDELRLAGAVSSVEEAEAAFRSGKAELALVIPADHARALARGEDAPVQLLVDGSDAGSARQVMNRAELMGRALSLGQTDAPLPSPPVALSTWTRFNPGSRSALFLVPGLAAYILALSSVLLTALTVAREWERGSMEQLFATPVGRLEIVLGKLIPYVAIGLFQVLLVISLGATVFDVPLRGSLFTLSVASLLFLVGMLGQGLLISVVTRNQMVATQAATMSAMLPSLLLSGFLFPIENMPLVLRLLSNLVPARYFISVLRGTLLRGSGLSVHGSDLLALGLFAVLMLAASTARFQRRLA